METVTIRELRQNWPAVEKRLAAARELGFGVVLPR